MAKDFQRYDYHNDFESRSIYDIKVGDLLAMGALSNKNGDPAFPIASIEVYEKRNPIIAAIVVEIPSGVECHIEASTFERLIIMCPDGITKCFFQKTFFSDDLDLLLYCVKRDCMRPD